MYRWLLENGRATVEHWGGGDGPSSLRECPKTRVMSKWWTLRSAPLSLPVKETQKQGKRHDVHPHQHGRTFSEMAFR